MQQSRPTVLHVIPGLQTGGAEHMLAALVTARRKQPFSQIVVDLLGAAAGDSPPTEAIRAAGIPVHQLGGRSVFDLPIILLRLCGLIRQVRSKAGYITRISRLCGRSNCQVGELRRGYIGEFAAPI